MTPRVSEMPVAADSLSRIPVYAVPILCCVAVALAAGVVHAETVFVEAEEFAPSSPGWQAATNDQTRNASRVRTLWGARGPADAVATKTIALREAGLYRVWVRYLNVADQRGPFRVSVSAGTRDVVSNVFDLEADPQVQNWEYSWQFLETELPAGAVTLTLAKHEPAAASPYVRHVDCLLLTTDAGLVPDHVPYGPQTLMRIRLGAGYDRPVYVHLFVDHYRAPWYAHFALGLDGLREGISVPAMPR